MAEMKDGCVNPAKGPISQDNISVQAPGGNGSKQKEEKGMMTARVGKPAPDFELSAFVKDGFKNVRLSDFKGDWIVLCFYPGDFTFV